MSTPLRDVVSRMMELCPELGRTVPVTGLAVGSVTAAELATGESSQKFVNKWLWRAWAAAASTADRYRLCTAYTNTTGLLAHGGANYADTTVTGESLLICQYEPYRYIEAIQRALASLKFLDRTEFPTLQTQRRNWLHDLTWIEKPGDVVDLRWSNNPVLTRNRHFEKWTGYQATGGAFAPDFWTLTLNNSTAIELRRDTSAAATPEQWRNKYVLALVDDTGGITQRFSFLATGVSADSLASVGITAVMVARVVASGDWQVGITDGAGAQTTSSSVWSTTGAYIERTVAATFSSFIADRPLISTVSTAPAVAIYIGEFYAVPTASFGDAVRRDDFAEYPVLRSDYEFDQGSGSLAVMAPRVSRYGQYIVYSWRAFPRFTASRITAGTADADETDAPVIPLALGAIAKLYKGLAGGGGEDRSRYLQLAAEYGALFEQAALAFRNSENPQPGGRGFADRMKGPLAPSVR